MIAFAIRCLEWLDQHIIRHRLSWLCLLIDKELYGWDGNIWTGKPAWKKED